ncbi:hypothetical protein HAX54_029697, partial [Datura stramonium]|nr:hypothetical protein [Datura stramonium]
VSLFVVGLVLGRGEEPWCWWSAGEGVRNPVVLGRSSCNGKGRGDEAGATVWIEKRREGGVWLST